MVCPSLQVGSTKRRTMRTVVLATIALAGSALADPAQKPTLILSDSTFSVDGTVELEKSATRGDAELHKTERGVLNGVHYHFYYTDGSGTFAGTRGNVAALLEPYQSNWSIGCKKDPITDQRSCHMHMKDLWIYVVDKRRPIVSIGNDHFPGSVTTIRIDADSPISVSAKSDGNFPPEVSDRIISRLRRAKTITTRFMKWPYRSWVDESWDVYGFSEALAYVNWAVKHMS